MLSLHFGGEIKKIIDSFKKFHQDFSTKAKFRYNSLVVVR
jgi:hypothetical protein